MRVTFNDLAERELNDAAQYYERQRTGRGAAFIAEVFRCTDSTHERRVTAWPSLQTRSNVGASARWHFTGRQRGEAESDAKLRNWWGRRDSNPQAFRHIILAVLLADQLCDRLSIGAGMA